MQEIHIVLLHIGNIHILIHTGNMPYCNNGHFPIVLRTGNIPILPHTGNIPIVAHTGNIPIMPHTRNIPILSHTGNIPILAITENIPLIYIYKLFLSKCSNCTRLSISRHEVKFYKPKLIILWRFPHDRILPNKVLLIGANVVRAHARCAREGGRSGHLALFFLFLFLPHTFLPEGV